MNVKRIFLAAIIVVALALPSVASAWDCKGYNFNVTGGGSVRVENTSNSNEPSQTADVFVNGSKVINNASVPSMPAGTGWTEFATVTVPSGDWSWRVVGSSDCSDEGSYRGEVTATPTPTKAYEDTYECPSNRDRDTRTSHGYTGAHKYSN
jgi:hypothetical protein